MIIFSGIIASIPKKMFSTIYEDFFVNVRSGGIDSFIYHSCFLICGRFGDCLLYDICSNRAEYQIPIQYTKLVQGLQRVLYLPLKVNPRWCYSCYLDSLITTIPSIILPFFLEGSLLSHLCRTTLSYIRLVE